MALDGTIVFEIQTGGNDDNGGGYSSDDGGTDYSQQASAQLTLTDLACLTASTTLTSATGGFTSAMVDNLIQIKSGTNFLTGFYRITVYTDTNTVTIDRTASNGSDASAGTGSVGGALATPGAAAAAADVDGQKIYAKSGDYSLTTSTPGPGGPVLLASEKRISFEGYETTRGDLGAKPVIKANAQTSVVLFQARGGFDVTQHVTNFKVDGESQSGVTGFDSNNSYGDSFDLCEAASCTADGFRDGCRCTNCLADTCSRGYFLNAGQCKSCEAKDCTSHGFSTNTEGDHFDDCLARNCGTTSGHGFYSKWGALHTNCTSDGNTNGSGFSSEYETCSYDNCLASNNGSYGFDTQPGHALVNCAGYNNTSGNVNSGSAPTVNRGFVTVTADPYEGVGDYRPNTNASGGALLRGAGIGVVGQTNNRDIGAVQHTDPAGGGLTVNSTVKVVMS